SRCRGGGRWRRGRPDGRAALRLLLVDDHYLVRVGLSSVIAMEKDLPICAEASSGEQALALMRRENPDVVLMDQRLPGMSGAEATQAIPADFRDARIIILSPYHSDEEVYTAT